MASPTLREIARRGIDVRGAGHAEIAFPFVALVPLVLETLLSIYCGFVYEIDVGVVPLWLIHSITVAARLGLLLLLWQKPRDERCFILKMMSKIVAVYLTICCPLLAFWEAERSNFGQYRRWFPLPLTVYTSMFGLACALLALGFLSCRSHPECNRFLFRNWFHVWQGSE